MDSSAGSRVRSARRSVANAIDLNLVKNQINRIERDSAVDGYHRMAHTNYTATIRRFYFAFLIFSFSISLNTFSGLAS